MALRRIVLRDFVIVSALELDLSTGFTVLTGETGAGKSILIDALQLVTGARADTAVIREGCARTEVGAEFDCTPAVASWLEAGGFDTDDSLLLRRTVDQQGKSRGWVNGSPATAAQLRELGEQLLDIHGQHAWQSLTRPDAMRGLLDAYAKLDLAPLAGAWHRWRQAQRTLADAQASRDTLQRERERLAWQIGELDKLSPQADEWQQLNADHGRLSNAQSLLDAAQGAMDALQGEEHSAGDSLQTALQQLQQHAHVEPAFQAFADVLASSLAQVEDTAHGLRAYLRHTDLDPERLQDLDQRMGQWMSLSKRYKRGPEELPALLAGWKSELTQLDASADLAALEQSAKHAEAEYQQQAKLVSRARAKAAPELSKAITRAMQGLGMGGGRFEVTLPAAAQAQQYGMEEVHFLVAGHAGSTPRSVHKVASGGELSRIALAIAVTTSRLGPAQTLIFDEVDSGVGGAVAETVGQLLRQLGQDRQVLAVTHLPQVAACADHHLVVAKRQVGKTTTSSVGRVEADLRVAEIARMLGGERIGESTLAHAKDLLQTHD